MTRNIIIATAVLVATVPAHADSGPAKDVAALREAIRKSGEAANALNADAILSQYAPDAILSYPTEGDMDFATLSKGYRAMTNPPAGVTVKTVPTVEEVLVSGDLGVIRVSWTTTTTVAQPPKTSTRIMKDLQVWRREANGEWKMARGMHYRLSPPMIHAEQAAPKGN